MEENKANSQADALISLLTDYLKSGGSQMFGHLVLYTSFGVVKGRTGLAFSQELLNPERDGVSPELIELNDVTVEHYSNHLATASFDRFYVRLTEVQGFALAERSGQG